MVNSNPYDANNEFFQFNGENTGLASSAFSFQYNPKIITAYSANPNANIQGGVSPTGNQNLSFEQQNASNTQNTSATSITTPKIQNYTPKVGQSQQNSSDNSSGGSSPLNGNALNLISTAAQHSGVGESLLGGVTSSINNFGMGLGFGSGGGASEGISSALAAADPSLLASGATITEGATSAGALTGASLSGVLGAAGLGFMGGGILAHAIGGSEIGGSIGGAIGAGAGMAFGAAGAAALGLELGSFAGPIGAIVGGIGGALFGSLFGGGKQASYQALGVTDIQNWDSTSEYGSKNSGQDFVHTLGPQLKSYFSDASQYLGTPLQGSVSTGYNTQSKGGYFMQYQTPDGKTNTLANFDPNDNASKTAALTKVLQAAGASSGVDPAKLSSMLTNLNNNGTISGVSSGTNITGMSPSLPNNPKGAQEQSDWNTFLNNYKAQQNANAAPTPTS